MASATLPGVRVDVDSLVGLANRALRLNTWEGLQEAVGTLVEAKRKLDRENPDFRRDHGILYDYIGCLRYALDDLKAEDEKRIDVVALGADAEEALVQNSIPALVGARRRLQQAMDLAKTLTYQRRLRSQSRKLNEALVKLNDEQARKLLGQFNKHSQQVWDALDRGNYSVALVSYRRLLETAQQITSAKSYLRFAIDRVEKAMGGWEAIHEQVSQSIGSTQGLVDDLEIEVGKLHLTAAKGLASRFEACMCNGNIGGASAALRELSSVQNAAGLAFHLGSTKERDRFMESARRRLAPGMAKHLLRKERRVFTKLIA